MKSRRYTLSLPTVKGNDTYWKEERRYTRIGWRDKWKESNRLQKESYLIHCVRVIFIRLNPGYYFLILIIFLFWYLRWRVGLVINLLMPTWKIPKKDLLSSCLQDTPFWDNIEKKLSRRVLIGSKVTNYKYCLVIVNLIEILTPICSALTGLIYLPD